MQVSRRTAQKQTETYDLIKRNEQCPFDLRLTQAKEKSPEFHASYWKRLRELYLYVSFDSANENFF